LIDLLQQSVTWLIFAAAAAATLLLVYNDPTMSPVSCVR